MSNSSAFIRSDQQAAAAAALQPFHLSLGAITSWWPGDLHSLLLSPSISADQTFQEQEEAVGAEVNSHLRARESADALSRMMENCHSEAVLMLLPPESLED